MVNNHFEVRKLLTSLRQFAPHVLSMCGSYTVEDLEFSTHATIITIICESGHRIWLKHELDEWFISYGDEWLQLVPKESDGYDSEPETPEERLSKEKAYWISMVKSMLSSLEEPGVRLTREERECVDCLKELLRKEER